MRGAAFWITLVALLGLGACLLLSLLRPASRIWPPPGRRSWQYRLVWTLTDVAGLGIAAVGVLDWNTSVLDSWLRLPVGAALAVGGCAFALWGVRELSVHATLGLEGEFVRSGPYRWTRNPQYVGDIVLLAGWALLCNSLATGVLCALAIACFALAPVVEEPWLRARYGEAYDRYCRRVPRYLGVPAAESEP